MARGVFVAASLAALAALAAGCATTSTGSIEGRVHLADGPRLAERTVVTAAPEDAAPAPPQAHSTAGVELAQGRFAPGILLVSSGTRVRFHNGDRVYHVPFSVTPGAAFELGRCAPGSNHARAFDHAGVIEVFCALHPAEHLYVVVAPDRWHAYADPEGRFAFKDLPPGRYVVRAWSPARGEVARHVDVRGSAPAVVVLER